MGVLNVTVAFLEQSGLVSCVKWHLKRDLSVQEVIWDSNGSCLE